MYFFNLLKLEIKILFNSKKMNFNDSKNNLKLNDNKKNEEPVYVMTVELEKGKSENIKIYSNSKPEELAYEFCKKNNLDFSSQIQNQKN